MPVDKKISKITDAFVKMVMITPNMVTDLLGCPAIKGNSDQLNDWLAQNSDANGLIMKIQGNFLRQSLPILGHVATGLTNMARHDYYGFGSEIGASIRKCLE